MAEELGNLVMEEGKRVMRCSDESERLYLQWEVYDG